MYIEIPKDFDDKVRAIAREILAKDSLTRGLLTMDRTRAKVVQGGDIRSATVARFRRNSANAVQRFFSQERDS